MSLLGDILKNLNDPAPKDIDPESADYEYEAEGVLNTENIDREHYVDVGPSRLKKSQGIELTDKKYSGKKSSRKEIFGESDDESESESEAELNDEEEDEEIDSDKELNIMNQDDDDDEENNDEDEDVQENDEDDEDDEEEEENEENEDSNEKISIMDQELKDEFKELEKEEKSLVNNINQSVQSDIEKGKQVKKQLKLCDSVLDLRIRIQKSVNIANQFPQYDVYPLFVKEEEEEINEKLNEAKTETLELINDLLEVKQSINKNNKEIYTDEERGTKRKRTELEDEDYMDSLWEEISEDQEKFESYQNTILEKWNKKVQSTAGIQKQFKAVNQSIVSQIEQLLTDKERLVKRTQLKRSDYRSLGKNSSNEENDKEENDKENMEHVDEHLANYDKEIFDDTDFYQQLLKELIETRMVENDDPMAISMKWATFKALQQKNKKKKKVDTRASKGRKIRYHVHEKIQNFMVPIATATWHEEMTNELFHSLFGQNIEIEETSKNMEPEVDLTLQKNEEGITTTDGLRLFG